MYINFFLVVLGVFVLGSCQHSTNKKAEVSIELDLEEDKENEKVSFTEEQFPGSSPEIILFDNAISLEFGK